MKKILFATTALVATAGVAAADVSFSGYGRFGVSHSSATGNSVITSRLRLQIDMSTEADNGLSFGARLRHQQDAVDGTPHARTPNGHGFNQARFHMRAGGLEVGVGNIQGAIEWMPGLYLSTQSAGVGLNGGSYSFLPSASWDAYESRQDTARRNQGVEVKYSAGDFGGHLSYTNQAGEERTAAHVSYGFSGWTVALGYQGSTVAANDGLMVLTVGGKIGNASIGLMAADTAASTTYSINGQVEVGAATTITAYIASDNVAGEAYGLGVSHSLGGGASLEAGIDRNYGGTTTTDLGVRFNF